MASKEAMYIQYICDKNTPSLVDKETEMKDFYNSYDPYKVTKGDKAKYAQYLKTLNSTQKAILNKNKFYTQVDFKNVGGIVMPLILKFTYKDNSSQEIRIPVEIWRSDNWNISKVFITDKQVVKVELDPHLETADTDVNNNIFPREISISRFELYQRNRYSRSNPMQKK